MSPTMTILTYIAVAAIFLFVGIGADQLVTWDRQVSIAAAEYRMNRAERQSEELLRAALQVSDAVQPRAIGAGSTDDHVTGELLAVDHVEVDEDAPADDTDRTGMWRVLLGLVSDLVDRVHDWLPNLLRQWRERNDIGAGDGIGEVLAASGYELDEETDEEFEAAVNRAEAQAWAEPVRIVRVNRYRDPGETGQFPYVKVAGAAHHAAPEPEMPAINPIPKQRDGEVA